MKNKIAINECGRRIGEDHHNACYSNVVVERVLALREGGMSYGKIARRTNVPKGTVRDFCVGRRRGQLPVGFKAA